MRRCNKAEGLCPYILQSVVAVCTPVWCHAEFANAKLCDFSEATQQGLPSILASVGTTSAA
ncbi:hypothetical protein [Xylella fastidiosa]|uniref:hypothetical protein n=1 Tax=Xylella fastidiosa TaxID=2371 RepID=UPI000F8603C9